MSRKFSKRTKGYISSHGYRVIRSNGKRIYEHRYVMEKYLKRRLKSSESVHHINDDKLDNRIDNLKLFSGGESEHHSFEIKNKLTKPICRICGKRFSAPYYNHHYCDECRKRTCETCGKIFLFDTKKTRANKHRFCSKECRNKWLSNFMRGNNYAKKTT